MGERERDRLWEEGGGGVENGVEVVYNYEIYAPQKQPQTRQTQPNAPMPLEDQHDVRNSSCNPFTQTKTKGRDTLVCAPNTPVDSAQVAAPRNLHALRCPIAQMSFKQRSCVRREFGQLENHILLTAEGNDQTK